MTDYSQEFGEGVDRLYEVMKSEGLPQPEYKTQAFMLSATIRNTKTDGSLWGTPQAIPQVTPKAEEILAFCMIARTKPANENQALNRRKSKEIFKNQKVYTE